MSRVRGGNNFFQIRIGDRQPLSFRRKVDILVPLNGESVSLHRADVNQNGRIILDKKYCSLTDDDALFLDVPFQETALRIGGKAHYSGSVALGAVAGALGLDFSDVEQTLQNAFSAKGPLIAQHNVACAEAGFRIGQANPVKPAAMAQSRDQRRYLIDGNEAVALGALYAGCRFYTGYPMTPSTTIMETLAEFANKNLLVVEQAEDEIAAINMTIGASFAGVRAMTGTSGGGFALMTEGISLAAMTETPVVIVNGQRPAPATGFPTRTEQADLNLVINAGHGEFARVIYAPGNLEEAFELTVRAFDVSDRFQVPAIILTDQFLADTACAMDHPATAGLPRQRHILPGSESPVDGGYLRYRLTESGISPRAVPSWIPDVIYVGSDEHTEEGHITEDAGIRTAMVEKRFVKKMELLRAEALPPVAAFIEGARFILLGFGSTRETIEEVCSACSGMSVGCVHFPQVWPFPAAALENLLERAPGASLITVENNAGGQLARLIKMETHFKIDRSILKFNGRPFSFEELFERVNEIGGIHGSKPLEK
jgi:2-oxoglutarate ferredoxin oxidoreductase subunit alpha